MDTQNCLPDSLNDQLCRELTLLSEAVRQLTETVNTLVVVTAELAVGQRGQKAACVTKSSH
jgi:hypothetical protein